MKKIVFTTLLTVMASMQSFAHYLWVETSPTGKLGQEQEIRVYFGEYTYGVIEEVEGEAFPPVSNFTLWVLNTNGKKTVLKTKAKENYYVAHYTPELSGTYTVLLNNDNIDVIDYTQYDFGIFKTHYHSVTTFQVGSTQSETLAQNDKGITLKYIPSSSGEVKLQVLYKNKFLANNELKVYVSDLWSKTLETDEEGFVSFKLPWKTKYIVETTIKEEVAGTYKGEAYEFVWHCVTTCIN
ncbi:putative GH25 family protein [Saonia flava]|uniref:Putative GH25 family protein n=1 Tax=Saonia flava TaxID=523696 RepID=A0A846R401_9FLAO|nr:DUF4198 domain-containing protein [Saonia flava]NJB72695.1 putative GH25 family protein [Saonia flava]